MEWDVEHAGSSRETQQLYLYGDAAMRAAMDSGIMPSDRSFSMKDENRKSFTIHRRQMAMTPVYAFTDFKSQGQTLIAIFVDLALQSPTAN
jgi:hypothetical protein